MRRTARLTVVILALAAGGLLWKGDAPDLPDPESPPLLLEPARVDPVPEYDPDRLYDGIWPLPGARSDGALDVQEDYTKFPDY